MFGWCPHAGGCTLIDADGWRSVDSAGGYPLLSPKGETLILSQNQLYEEELVKEVICVVVL